MPASSDDGSLIVGCLWPVAVVFGLYMLTAAAGSSLAYVFLGLLFLGAWCVAKFLYR
jgi:hypothetical protein